MYVCIYIANPMLNQADLCGPQNRPDDFCKLRRMWQTPCDTNAAKVHSPLNVHCFPNIFATYKQSKSKSKRESLSAAFRRVNFFFLIISVWKRTIMPRKFRVPFFLYMYIILCTFANVMKNSRKALVPVRHYVLKYGTT